MIYLTIESKDNALIKKIAKLCLHAKHRLELGQAVIYGQNLVIEAQNHHILDTLLIAEESVGKYESLLRDLTIDRVYVVSQGVMAKLNVSDTPSDIVGVVRSTQFELSDTVYNEDCVILENIQDPGNLGTILRSCKAAGVKNVILSKGCANPSNIKVIRSSQGAQFGLNLFTDIDLSNFIQKYHGQVLLTTLNTSTSLYALSLVGATAFVFGNEGVGLSKELSVLVANQVKIPMPGAMESLNVAMAATICLFEMVRQRETFMAKA